MEEQLPSELPASTSLPTEDELVATARPQGRNRKLMLILATMLLGGAIIGVGGTLVISSLFKEKPNSVPVTPVVREAPRSAAPAPAPVPVPVSDPKQEALIKELKAQNERLETQIKQQAALTHSQRDAPAKIEEPVKVEPKPVPPPPRVIYRTVKANEKPKVAEDCTITEKDDGLGERLKKCIDDFNKATH